jgi:hypothetical protein
MMLDTTKHVSQDSRATNRGMNLGPSAYQIQMPLTAPRRSVAATYVWLIRKESDYPSFLNYMIETQDHPGLQRQL